MDKHEFKIKAEQMQSLVQRRDYKMAAKIADGIEWRRVRNVELLTMVSEIYEKLGRYEDSYEVLNMAYDRAPIGRTIVYRMAEMALRMGDYEEAKELFKEFVDIAPHDLNRYILKYKIYQATERPAADQISVLEEFKSREYHEKWAYELASLYYKEGMNARCVEECDDLILWFNEGEYVRKAMELKMRVQPLTASQEEKYQELTRQAGLAAKEKKSRKAQDEEPRARAAKEDAPPEDEGGARAEEEEIQVRTVNPDERYSTVNLQAELAEGLKDLLSEGPGNISGEGQEAYEEAARQAEEEEIQREKEARRRAAREAMERREELQSKEEARRQEEAARQAEKAQLQGERLRLGQSKDGQMTFNAEENILERQITGQMTIEEVMAEWEAKKQHMKERLDVLAEKEEERRKEEALRRQEEERLHRERQAAGLETEDGLPNLIPPDVQLLLDEIEGKLPVKIIVEPIERARAERKEADKPLDKAQEEKSQAFQELPEDIDKLEEILTAALEEELEELEKAKEPVGEPENTQEPVREPEDMQEEPAVQKAPRRKKEKPMPAEKGSDTAEPLPKSAQKDLRQTSNMMWDLEKVLESELKHVSGQYLTEEQGKLFAYFTSVHGMNQQLSQFLEDEKGRELDGTSTAGNLVVTGESGNGKTTLAIDMVRAVQKQRRAKGSKVARVTGKALSQKDVAAAVRKLSGGALVIEHAGGLTTEAAAKLSGAMLGQTENLFVVLEDDASEIKKLFTRCESLAAKFDRTIEIPAFTNNELVAFGKSYGLEQGYVLDEMAVLALYNRIGNNQTSSHLVNVSEVKELMDDAIVRARRKGVKKLFSKRRQDELGNYVLMEKDFEE